VSSAFTVAEVERMICEGVIKDGVTVAVFGLLRLKGRARAGIRPATARFRGCGQSRSQ
jgi:hypothetical protein